MNPGVGQGLVRRRQRKAGVPRGILEQLAIDALIGGSKPLTSAAIRTG